MSKYGKTRHRKIYNDPRWRRLSLYRRSIEPLCRLCKENGFTTESTQADHIEPLETGGNPFDLHNTQSICDACHFKKTQKELKEQNQDAKLENRRTKKGGGYISI